LQQRIAKNEPHPKHSRLFRPALNGLTGIRCIGIKSPHDAKSSWVLEKSLEGKIIPVAFPRRWNKNDFFDTRRIHFPD
jgi:hypothetical protein